MLLSFNKTPPPIIGTAEFAGICPALPETGNPVDCAKLTQLHGLYPNEYFIEYVFGVIGLLRASIAI